MSDTTTTPNDTGNPQGTTVTAASETIAALLAREDGEPAEQGEDQQEAPARDEGEAEAAEAQTQDEEPDEGDEAEAEDGEGADEEGEEPDEPEASAKAITIEIDGKPLTLTADEVRNGYLRQADYTRKTTALAEERRAFHQQAAVVMQERQQYAALLPALEQQLRALSPQEPDWDRLAAEDPVEFNRQWAAKQLRDQKLTAIQQEQQRLAALQMQESEQQTAQRLAEERQRLVAANPRWRDPERWQQDRAAVRDYLAQYGYGPDEISAVTDHRAVVIAHKARLYDEAMKRSANTKQAAPRPQQARPAAPAVSRPGTATTRMPVSELTCAKQRLAKTHSIRDAASVIERLL